MIFVRAKVFEARGPATTLPQMPARRQRLCVLDVHCQALGIVSGAGLDLRRVWDSRRRIAFIRLRQLCYLGCIRDCNRVA